MPTTSKTRVRNIDERMARIEQMLPTPATKDDLKAFPTREDAQAVIREEGERTRQQTELKTHDRRIMKLEAASLKRRQSN
jgi:hypothetical protein